MERLHIGKIPASQLAKQYGTPLYVFDEEKIINNIRTLKKHFVSNDFSTQILYASKAFQTVAMVNLVAKEGLGLDVVSGGEIYTATKSNIEKEKVYFHGNNKSEEELTFFIKEGFTHIILDNEMELQQIGKLATNYKKRLHIMLRLNVGIEAHTHRYILTSQVDSKFGIDFESKEGKQVMLFIQKHPYLVLEGFHAHIGSQIFEQSAWKEEIKKLVHYVKTTNQVLSLNLGGGFGIRYTDEDQPLELDTIACFLIKELTHACQKQKVRLNKVYIEPGRSLVGQAGTTLYTVGYLKQTPHKHYAFIDGGMTDNIRPALYQAHYCCDAVDKMEQEKTKRYTIAGKRCESGDIVIQNARLPLLTSGDILAVYATGAYGYTMSSNYNRARIPAVVFVNQATSRLIVRRQTYHDLLQTEVGE